MGITVNILIKLMMLIVLFISFNIWSAALPAKISVMTLNVYGWKTMPAHSNDYANLIHSKKVDIVAIQEGVDDWQLTSKFPTDYSRSKALRDSLGTCWQHRFQIFINQCSGIEFVKSGRFDLSDGPNATRTGEYAVVKHAQTHYLIVNVHWDHESQATRLANAQETATLINSMSQYPTILLGDFNESCDEKAVSEVAANTQMTLLKSAGIDCIFTKAMVGTATVIAAQPSDHPSIIATLKPSIH